MSDLQIGPVMAFSGRRRETATFYRDVVGLAGDDGDDSTWFEALDVKLAVHDQGDRQTPPEIKAAGGFVVWFGVADVRAAFDRARHAGAAASEFHGDYFFARDPDGRYVGIYALEDHHGHDHEH
ncbi:MAG TPA: VOC family protein [Candidatus Limnocylindria bacterium]|nr:VOC family protein [Candidatus Limnocylindria bacterium]